MRVLLVADIHSNLEAFEAVLADARTRGGFDRVWCLGDVVGYGPDPGACIERLRGLEHLCVAGNHDWAAAERISAREMNADAAAACAWTTGRLTAEERRYLEELTAVVEQGTFTLAHGSLRNPIWEYLLSYEAAGATFAQCQTPYCLVGHSHIPFVCEEGHGFAQFEGDESVVTLEGARLIINPGSVGQPRDGDPRASYAILDTEAAELSQRRVAYPIPVVQEKMRLAQLPPRLIQRLTYGR